jgi:hypothetical protein
MAKGTNLKSWVVVSLVLACVWVGGAAGDTIYVDDDANAGGDGGSWATAYKYLQDGLREANSNPDVNQIWVGDGNYYPDANTSEPNGSGNREASFQLISGVALYGGYAGYGAPDPNERDPNAYETILSGDLDGDDVGDANRGENSYHVVSGAGSDGTAVLDGFTVSGGNANGVWVDRTSVGGGMYIENSSPLVSKCTFTGNSSLDYGGGMYIGGHSNAVIRNCQIIGNDSNDDGGGMFIKDDEQLGCRPLVIGCVIRNNTAVDGAGGIRCDGYTMPTIKNCVISGNVCGDDGGGIACKWESSPKIVNCTITGNLANIIGGGLYCIESTVVVSNCILWGNKANYGNEIALRPSEEPLSSIITISYSDVRGGEAGVYIDPCCVLCALNWGMGNMDVDPCFGDSGGWTDPCGTPGDVNDDVWLEGDYHLKSNAGRWDPNSESWMVDGVTSLCIDKGDPATLVGDEPYPNGGRINMGAYGGTEEASKSSVITCWESAECGGQMLGDANCDGAVAFLDLGLVKVSFFSSKGGPNYNCCADFNHDEAVNFIDLGIMKANFFTTGHSPATGNQSCPP